MKLFLKRLGTMAGDVWRCCALNAVFEEKSKNHWKEIAIWCPKPSSNILWESLGSLSEGFKDWWVDIVFVHLYHADVWFFSEKKKRTSRSLCQIQSVEEMIQFHLMVLKPNWTQPDGFKPPMEAMDFFDSSWDQMIRLPGSPTAPWWLEQMTPTYRGVKGFFDEHVSCEWQRK